MTRGRLLINVPEVRPVDVSQRYERFAAIEKAARAVLEHQDDPNCSLCLLDRTCEVAEERNVALRDALEA